MKKRIIAIVLCFVVFTNVLIQPKQAHAEAILGSMLLYTLGAGLLGTVGYVCSDKESTAEVVEGLWDFVTPNTDYEGTFLNVFGHLSEKELLKISAENEWDLQIEEMSNNKERKIRTKIGDSFKEKINEYVDSLPDTVDVDAYSKWETNPVLLKTCELPSCYYPANTLYARFNVTVAGEVRLGVSNGGWGSYNTLSLDVGSYTLSTTSNKRHELRTSSGSFITSYCWTSSLYENYPDSDAYKMTCYGLASTFGSTAVIENIEFNVYHPAETHSNDHLVPFGSPSNEVAWDNTGAIDIPYTPSLDREYTPENVNAWEQENTIEYPYVNDVANEVEIPWVETLTEEQVIEDEKDVPIEGVEDIILPMTPFYESSGKLTDKFPFCIPFDLVKCIEGFERQGNSKVHFEIPFPYVQKFDIDIDLADYETPLTILRFFELLAFIIGILILTRNLIRG